MVDCIAKNREGHYLRQSSRLLLNSERIAYHCNSQHSGLHRKNRERRYLRQNSGLILESEGIVN